MTIRRTRAVDGLNGSLNRDRRRIHGADMSVDRNRKAKIFRAGFSERRNEDARARARAHLLRRETHLYDV